MRFRVRTLVLGVGVVSVVMGLAREVHRRHERFRYLACYHRGAATRLENEALGFASILHHLSDEQRERIADGGGPEKRLAYEASKYHWNLCDKYMQAEYDFKLWVPADPPPPPLSNPSVHVFDWEKWKRSERLHADWPAWAAPG